MVQKLLLLFGVFAAPVLAALPGNTFVEPLSRPAPHRAVLAKSQLTALTQVGQRLFAAGRHGMIAASVDGGASWKQQAVPVESDLVAINFATPLDGWAVGHDGVVLSSKDGGSSWVKRFDGHSLAALIEAYYRRELAAHPGDAPLAAALAQARQLVSDGADKPLLDVWFRDERHGYIVGAFNLIIVTEDGGASWTPWLDRTDNPDGLHLNAVRGTADDVYIAGERGLVRRLDAGKQRFVALASPYNGSFFGLVIEGDDLVVFGLQGRAFRSGDKGASWLPLATDTRATLSGGAFLADGRLAMVGDDGYVLLANGPGTSFSRHPCLMSCYAIAAGKHGAVVVAGASGAHSLPLN